MTGALNSRGTSPSLTVNDVNRSLQFYTEALGFEIVNKHEQDGKLRFAALKAGDASISIGQDDFAKGRDRQKGIGVRFWFNTSQDIAALAARVKAAGFKLDSEPAPLPWGPMAFALSDPDGYVFTVSHQG